MANAILFFIDANGDDVADAISAGQALEFNNDTIVLHEQPELVYGNSIKQTPNPTNDGSRIINVTENGLRANNIPLSLHIKRAETVAINLLKTMITVQQINPALRFGRFGLAFPNSPEFFTFTPDNTFGYSIGDVSVKYNATAKQIDCKLTLLFGGKYV